MHAFIAPFFRRTRFFFIQNLSPSPGEITMPETKCQPWHDRQTYQPTSWVSFRHAWRRNFMPFLPPLQGPPSFNVRHWFFVRDRGGDGGVSREEQHSILYFCTFTITKSCSAYQHSVKKFYGLSTLVTGQKFAMIWWGSGQLSQYSDYAMRWMNDKYGLHFRQRLE